MKSWREVFYSQIYQIYIVLGGVLKPDWHRASEITASLLAGTVLGCVLNAGIVLGGVSKSDIVLTIHDFSRLLDFFKTLDF